MKIELDEWEISQLCFHHYENIKYWKRKKAGLTLNPMDPKECDFQINYHTKKWREFQKHKELSNKPQFAKGEK